MIGLNVADGFLLFLLLISAALGLYRGLVREIITLITWILAVYLSFMYGKEASHLFSFVETESIRNGFSIALVFFATLLIGAIIKFIICKAFSIAGPSVVDRVGGLAFGVVRACSLIIAVFLLAPNSMKEQSWYAESKLIPTFNTMAKVMVDTTPRLWKQEAEAKLHAMMS